MYGRKAPTSNALSLASTQLTSNSQTLASRIIYALGAIVLKNNRAGMEHMSVASVVVNTWHITSQPGTIKSSGDALLQLQTSKCQC